MILTNTFIGVQRGIIARSGEKTVDRLTIYRTKRRNVSTFARQRPYRCGVTSENIRRLIERERERKKAIPLRTVGAQRAGGAREKIVRGWNARIRDVALSVGGLKPRLREILANAKNGQRPRCKRSSRCSFRVHRSLSSPTRSLPRGILHGGYGREGVTRLQSKRNQA